MKRFVIILLLVCVVFFSLVYVDYFNTKTNNTYPKLSLKSENDDAVIYTAVLYRVWYCKTNKKYMIGSYSEDSICPKNYEYTNDTYTNTNGISISKRDLQLLTNDGIYTSEMIENMNSKKQVDDAVHVAYDYMKNVYKVVNETESNKIIIFPEFKEKDGRYEWVYEEDENSYYCLSSDEKMYAKYDNVECGKFVPFKMDSKWCQAYQNSTLVYEDHIEDLCGE